MDNLVLRSALVSQYLSNGLVDSEYARETTTESSNAIAAERASFNADRRTIAIGGSEEIWLHDLLANATPEWWSMIRSVQDALEMMVIASRPQNILSFNAGIGAGMHKWANQNPSTKVTFINNAHLDAYEQHMMVAAPEHASAEYDVISVDELENVIEEKFDFIFAMAFDIVSDPEVQQLCVNALASHGILYIALSNNGSKVYRDGYHTHPYADVHEFLKLCNGVTYHIPDQYGFTVFIKN